MNILAENSVRSFGRASLCTLLIIFLSACGGSGGGNSNGGGSTSSNASGDFSISTNIINFSGVVGTNPTQIASIDGTLKNANGEVYLVVDSTGASQLIANAQVLTDGTGSGKLQVTPTTANMLKIGKNTGTIILKACKNQSCSSQYSGSPKVITVNYEVTAPAYTFTATPETLTFHTTENQAIPSPQQVNMTFSSDVSFYGWTLYDNGGQWLAIDQQWSGTNGTATFSVTKTPAAGTYSAYVELFALGKGITRRIDITLIVDKAAGAGSGSTSSSSSSSSSSPATQNVFVEQLDSAWKGLTAYEATKDNSSGNTYTSGTAAQLIHWSVLPSNDSDHGNVIDIEYTNASNYNALFEIPSVSASGANMDEYATGKLAFDIKRLTSGTFNPQIEVLIGCIYPCTSHTFPISTPNLNQWYSKEIAVADLVEQGLDLSKVSSGFIIQPQWGLQTGVRFQIDNIRWIKGTTHKPVTAAACYRQPFETWNLTYHFDWLGGSPNVLNNALIQIIAQTTTVPNWSSTTDKFAYDAVVDSTFSPCAFKSGTLSAQLYLAQSYVTDGKLQLGFYYEDNAQRRAYFAPISAAGLMGDKWQTISKPLSGYNSVTKAPFSEVDSGFNENAVNYLGLYFYANGKPIDVVGEISLDNIQIK